MANPFTSAQAPQASPAMQIIAPDLAAQQLNISKLQQIAQMLRDKGMTDAPQTQMVSGWAVKQSPIEGLSRLASMLGGAYLDRKSMDQNMDLQKAFASRLQNAANGSGAMSGGAMSGDAGGMGGADAGAAPSGVQGGNGIGLSQNQGMQLLANKLLYGDQAEKVIADRLTEANSIKEARQMGISPQDMQQLYLAKQIKDGTQTLAPNQTNILPNNQRIVAADFANGFTGGYDAQGNPTISGIPGADQIAASRAGAISSAQEGSKVNTYTDPKGNARVMTNAQALGASAPSNVPAGVPSALLNNPYANRDVVAELSNKLPIGSLSAISQIESNHTLNAVNKNNNGSVDNGRFQVNNSHPNLDGNDPMAVGKFFSGLLAKAGGDVNKAAAMYHVGENGDLNSPEAKNYVAKFQAAMGQDSAPAGMQVQSAAQAEAQKKNLANSVDYEQSLNGQLSKSQALMKRLELTRDALNNFKSGGGKEIRADIAEKLQGLGLPNSVVDSVAGGDLGAMQTTKKLAIQEALQNMQNALASDSGVQSRSNKQLIQSFIDSNPNLDTDPRAMEKLLNFQSKMHNDLLNQSNAFYKYKSDPTKDITEFPNYWANQEVNSGNVKPIITSNTSYNVKNASPTPANIQALLNKYK